jgi:hypothetical protein
MKCLQPCSDCLLHIPQFLKQYLCCFKQNPPIFDYDEIDDLEFEQLLGNTTVYDDSRFYEAEMIVNPAEYTIEISSDDEVAAKEYTREEIDRIISHVVDPPLNPILQQQNNGNYEEKQQVGSNEEKQNELLIEIDPEPVKPLIDIEEDEFNPALLQLLTSTNRTDYDS